VTLTSDSVDDARLTTHEWVLAKMRRDIYNGVWSPGSRVVQTDIAKLYGVSVTPVREAMRDLLNDGLITADPHKPATIRALNVAEAVEINDLRMILEPLAVRRATPHISDDELRQLEQLSVEMTRSHDPKKWVELNERFHAIIIDATRLPNLIGILSGLRRVSRFYFAAALRADGGDYGKRDHEHDELIARLRERDAEGAGRIMDSHLSPSDELERRLTLARDGE